MKTIVKEEIEAVLGFEVSIKEFCDSIARATAKQMNLIKRFGDADGQRRTSEYQRQLIIEDLRSWKLSKETLELYKDVNDIDKEHSENRKCPLQSTILYHG